MGSFCYLVNISHTSQIEAIILIKNKKTYSSLLAFTKSCFTKLINKWKSNEMRNQALNWRSTKETGIAEEWKISPTNESFPPVLPKMILRVVSWERLICFRSTCWPEKDCGPLPTPPITCHQNHQLLVI